MSCEKRNWTIRIQFFVRYIFEYSYFTTLGTLKPRLITLNDFKKQLMLSILKRASSGHSACKDFKVITFEYPLLLHQFMRS